jgi:hypothetical protein
MLAGELIFRNLGRNTFTGVIAGLDPAIHPFEKDGCPDQVRA